MVCAEYTISQVLELIKVEMPMIFQSPNHSYYRYAQHELRKQKGANLIYYTSPENCVL